MKKMMLSLTALSLGMLVMPAFADPVPYPNIGHVASSPSLPIKATGNVLDLYYYGGDAADNDYIVVFDLTNHTNSGDILGNKTSYVGEEYTFATNPGDTLEF